MAPGETTWLSPPRRRNCGISYSPNENLMPLTVKEHHCTAKTYCEPFGNLGVNAHAFTNSGADMRW